MGVRPSYWNCFSVGDSVASVDMVRLKIHLKTGGKQAIGDNAQKWDCFDEFSGWTAKVKPGAWHELLSFGIGETSVALGLGQKASRRCCAGCSGGGILVVAGGVTSTPAT